MSTASTILLPGSYIVPQPPPPPLPQVIVKSIFAGLQLGSFQTLWGVGRSKPVNNPPVHGTVSQTPGSPSLFDFHPAVVTDPSTEQRVSDNLYNMRTLINEIDPGLVAIATKFTNSMVMKVDNTNNVQALELDYPTPRTQGTMGLQLLPVSATLWQIRAFNFNKGDWETLQGTTFPSTLLTSGVLVGGEYTCDDKNVTHTCVLLNGLRLPVNFQQSCGAKRSVNLLNAAFQLDATVDARPYKFWTDNFNITLQ